MQILWISHVIPYPPKAGFLLRAYHLLRGTAKHHTVDLVAFIQEPWLRTIYGDVETGLCDAREALGAICRSVQLIPITSRQGRFAMPRTALRALMTGRSYTTTWLDQPDARHILRQMPARNNYDLVHFDTIGLAPFRDCIPKQVATTLGHHNVESHLFTRRSQTEANPAKQWYYKREGRLLNAYERDTAGQFTAHVTCSDLDSERLQEAVGRVPTHAVPNGVDCDYFTPSAEEPVPYTLTFIGTMNWHPNADAMAFFLTEVWPELLRRLPQITLEIVGANAPQTLVDLVNQSKQVRLAGFVPDVRPYLAKAQIFICPIRDGGGTKLKILDAFAAGKAVVAHPIALEGINATHHRDVVTADTANEFVEAICSLIANDETRKLLGRNARQLAEDEYSFAAIGDQFAALLTHIAGSISGNADDKSDGRAA